MTRSPWAQLARWTALVTAVTLAVVTTGGTLVWLAERHAPRSNLLHWGDCLWWAVTTLTTVGYGEHYPVTLVGRLVAVGIMFSGVGIIGAVAAVVAFAFASRVTQRLEAAVSHMESQVEHVEAEMEHVAGRAAPGAAWAGGLRELVFGVADTGTAASLTWLLARLGWHPEAGDRGVAWRGGGLLMRIAVRPWDIPFGVQGRLTFDAHTPERLERIAREATQHGFHAVHGREAGRAAPRVPAGPVPIEEAARVAVEVAARLARDADGAGPPRGSAGRSVVLRTTSGFEVELVPS